MPAGPCKSSWSGKVLVMVDKSSRIQRFCSNSTKAVDAFAQNVFWILASVLGLVLIKAAVVGLIMYRGGLGWAKAIEGGFLLSQGGEFAFVIIGVAATTRILSPDIAQFMLLVVSVSLLLTPVFRQGGALFRSLCRAKIRFTGNTGTGKYTR